VGIVVCAARRRTPSSSPDRGRSGCTGAPGFQGTREGSLVDISRVDQEQDARTALFSRYKEVSVAVRTEVRSIENGHGFIFIIVVQFMSESTISDHQSRLMQDHLPTMSAR